MLGGSYHHNKWITIVILVLTILFAVFNNSIVKGGIQNQTADQRLNDADTIRHVFVGGHEYELTRK